MSANLAASVHARLLNRAQRDGEDFNLLLARYALERWLYRLSISPERERLVLKGALLFALWFDTPHRPTRDADFLGFGPADVESLTATVARICTEHCDDGMRYDAGTIVADTITKDTDYDGQRLKLMGWLGKIRCPIQLDVGFGDAVTPAPLETAYPTLLADLPAPRLRVYPRQTVIAEKLEAIIDLGMRNSRMKDYFDLLTLMRDPNTPNESLHEAIAATCARRRTLIPEGWPIGLTDEFAENSGKRLQWDAFLRKNRLLAPPLAIVVQELRERLVGPLDQAREKGA
ncbi:MAG: nucleotidyl transferase AbiEii/AbiGii toxin family protein [Hydrocarboniphaga sp.]|uniref:nucleotidyl transferase AbiEii/AbiGii toxin family protein n=1 Tax=Hydrocarboniphaga sp. TaxID=2033016 RepID=UPI00261263C8|nr:nucleotidyl transferase AbiEii/AbiGii toxin family protein [Hydrocarboniphaga sp.]MDB5970272.1 nucleotidyl transferase AbiEii/AbiGii toxin family protein [Hydrocarboniphaga sp.]